MMEPEQSTPLPAQLRCASLTCAIAYWKYGPSVKWRSNRYPASMTNGTAPENVPLRLSPCRSSTSPNGTGVADADREVDAGLVGRARLRRA